MRTSKTVLFPFTDRPRLWGVAVSHYQVEGNDPCDWTDWEASGRTRGGPCGAAVDSWRRYEEDAALAGEIGANAFRFSVSWSRVEPQRDRFDDVAMARYVRFVDALVAQGIEPAVTLFHYTHPSWFHGSTPWTSPAAVDRFARFARYVASAFGDRVRLWIPLNEPMVFLLAGYLDAQIPPGIADPRSLGRVFDHLLAAHTAAAAAIRESNPRAAIGIAHNMMAFAPDRSWNPLDRLLSRTAHRCYNLGTLDAFATGRWKFLLPPATIIRGRRDDLPRSLDFFGVNFYSRLHLRCPGKMRAIGDFKYRDRSGHGFTDNGWEIAPASLGPMLREAAATGLPLIVSENGLADANDRMRTEFLRRHVDEIRGVPSVHGYFHWSLLDNFEWLDGYSPKFGLVEVDRTTMARRPRPSAASFREAGRLFVGNSH
jgi:beta-glucosidase